MPLEKQRNIESSNPPKRLGLSTIYWAVGSILASVLTAYFTTLVRLPIELAKERAHVQLSVQGEGLKNHCKKLREGQDLIAFAVKERDKAMLNGGQKYISEDVANKVKDDSAGLSTYLAPDEQTALLTATRIYWGMANGTRSGWAVLHSGTAHPKQGNYAINLAMYTQENQDFETSKELFSSLYSARCDLK